MSDTLFDPSAGEPPRTRTGVPADQAPLAVRLRPRTLDELVGQQRLLREGSALRRALDEGHAHSMVLYGPPGTGKTTIARLVALAARAAFEELSAVEAGRAEVRAVLGEDRLVARLIPSSDLDLKDQKYNSPPLGWAIHGSEHGWNCGAGNYAGTVEALLQAGAKPSEKIEGADSVKEVLRRFGVKEG